MRATFITATVLFGAFVIFTGTFLSASASSVVRTGDAVSIQEDEVVEGDLYAAAPKVGVSGEVAEDLVIMGGQVTMNGTVGRDTLVVAGKADIHGTIGDDLRIVAGEVTIAEPILGDLFVFGGSIDLLSTASVTGDVILYGANATIEGKVGGNIYGTVEKLRIDAPVDGGVDVTVGQLTLGDRAAISENVRYTSNLQVERSVNATIGREMIQNDLPAVSNEPTTIYMIVLPLIILLFSALMWYWISPKTLRVVTGRLLIFNARPGLIGLAALFVSPIVVLFLFVSGVGVLVGFVLLFAYLLLVTLSIVALPATVGQLLMRSYNKAYSLSFLSMIVGCIGVAVLLLLPFIGFVVLFVFSIMNLGSMIDLLLRPQSAPDQAESRESSTK